MIRRPPRSTLFPTRRSSDLVVTTRQIAHTRIVMPRLFVLRLGLGRLIRKRRSEEHTSELQSRFDLVCRLLLEKKKLKVIKISTRISTSSILKLKLSSLTCAA